MDTLMATLTGTTCGAACWTAAEDICRCSCGGANHGCLGRGESQPQRMAKIDGHRYILAAIGVYDDRLEDRANEFNRDHGVQYWRWSAKARDNWTRKDMPAKVRMASKQQVASWPELASFRSDARWYQRPELMWVLETLKDDFKG